MTHIRRSETRGQADFGWLSAHYSFSFGRYFDPDYISFGPLRVLNEDWIAPGRGFPMHPHQDMEIVTYVIQGALAHKDSLGGGSVIQAGEVQVMSAGTGIRHSEYNASSSDKLHLLQIWLLPAENGLPPRHQHRRIDDQPTHDGLTVIGSPDGREGSLTIRSDVILYAARLTPQQQISHHIDPGRGAWLQMVSGSVLLGDRELRAGDSTSVIGPSCLELAAQGDSEFLLFDVGMAA